MIFRSSLLSRLGLILLLAQAIVIAPRFVQTAVAQDDDDDDDDDAYDDDDDAYDDDDDDDDDKEYQPPVTAGGLFTKKTYPIAELERPLTLTGGMGEVRGGIDIDVSKDTAFEIWQGKVDGRYGLKDYIELQAGASFVLAGDFESDAAKPPSMINVGIESAIAYDLVDFRTTAHLVVDPEFTFDLSFGFPFRYKPKPKVAIIALDKIMTIHTKSAPTGEVDEDGNPVESAKPDLTVGVGIVFQAAPPLAIILRGEVTIPRFDTDTVMIPATAAIQFSPTRMVDIGGEFTFGDMKADKPFDRRSLLLFGQFRF